MYDFVGRSQVYAMYRVFNFPDLLFMIFKISYCPIYPHGRLVNFFQSYKLYEK